MRASAYEGGLPRSLTVVRILSPQILPDIHAASVGVGFSETQEVIISVLPVIPVFVVSVLVRS